MQLKVAHIADVHLRTQQYGYKARGLDFFNAFKNAVMACYAAGADVILCSGDLFDTTSPASSLVIGQLGEIEQLLDYYGIRMIVSPGNHDYNNPHWASAYDCNGHIHVPAPNEVCKLADRFGIYKATVTALPWMPPNELREALEAAPEADILMWHGEIKEFTGYPKPDAIEMSDFPSGKWQLVAMGDQHVHRLITRNDGLIVAYPGSTESCSSSEDHNKKAYLYTLSGEEGCMQVTNIEDVPFETRPKQKLVLRTDEDVENACGELISGAMVYCHFHKDLKNVRNRLIAASIRRGLEPLTISMTSFQDKDSSEIVRIDHTSAIASPGQYVKENADKYFSGGRKNALTDLSVSLLTPGLDTRETISRFCSAALSEV